MAEPIEDTTVLVSEELQNTSLADTSLPNIEGNPNNKQRNKKKKNKNKRAQMSTADLTEGSDAEANQRDTRSAEVSESSSIYDGATRDSNSFLVASSTTDEDAALADVTAEYAGITVEESSNVAYESRDAGDGEEQDTFVEAHEISPYDEDVVSLGNPSVQDSVATATTTSEPPLPDRKPIKECLVMDIPTARLVESSELLRALKLSGSGGSRSTSANLLLESRYNQLDQKFHAKDSKSQQLINTGTQNIKKTFNDIKTTVGGLGDMFGYKIDWEFWTRVVNDYELVVKHESNELSDAIARGIPKEFRGIIWQLIAKLKNFQLEEFYMHLKLESSVHEKAIKRDLVRTSFFTHVEQVGKSEELFNVIKAYSLFDPDVGYTQGMIFVGVPLIMNMTDSECFCLLVTIMKEYNLRSLFCPEMKGLHLLLYEFDRLLELHCLRLFNYLAKQGIKSSMYALQWFLTFFAYKFPLDIVLRIYDIIITQGMELILKFALNLMMKNEANLLALRFDKLLEFLKDKMFNYYVNEDYIQGAADHRSRTVSVSRRFSLLGKRGTYSDSGIGGELGSNDGTTPSNSYYKLDLLVADSMTINLSPFDLKKYEHEFENIYANEKSKEIDIEEIKLANGKLRHEVKELELQYAALHREHVDIVQNLVDIKVSLPEVHSDIADLEASTEQLRGEVEDLESKIEQQSQSEPAKNGVMSPSLPVNVESDISKLLLINAEETDRYANLEDEFERLLQEERTLNVELEALKGRKWFRW